MTFPAHWEKKYEHHVVFLRETDQSGTKRSPAIIVGGSSAKAGYEVDRIIVAYRAEGPVPAEAQYFLLETDNGLALFERGEKGSGTLFETRWSDEQGDHFAAWIRGRSYISHAYEYIVPADRSQNARRFVYPAHTYELKQIDGVLRPVSNDPAAAAAGVLIPKHVQEGDPVP